MIRTGHSQAGFTLIELSIVLVIIGLLAAGILVGTDLIQAAVIRSEVSRIERLSAALNTFRAKYNGLPGDIVNEAQSYGFLMTNASLNPDNGIIDDQLGLSPPKASLYEPTYFFAHLAEAHLIEDIRMQGVDYCPGLIERQKYDGACIYYAFPQHPMAGMVASTWQGKTWIYWGIKQYLPFGNSNLDNLSGREGPPSDTDLGIISPSESYGIDSKMDDGFPTTGGILAVWHNNGQDPPIVIDTDPAWKCVSDLGLTPSIIYNFNERVTRCRLYIRLQ